MRPGNLFLIAAFSVVFVRTAGAQVIWEEDFEKEFKVGQNVNLHFGRTPEILLRTGAGSSIGRNETGGNHFLQLSAGQYLEVGTERSTEGIYGSLVLEFSFHPCFWSWGFDENGNYVAGGMDVTISDADKQDSVITVKFVFPENRPGKGFVRYTSGRNVDGKKEVFRSPAGSWNSTLDRWYRIRISFDFEKTGSYRMEIKDVSGGDWRILFSGQPIFYSHEKEKPLTEGKGLRISELSFFGGNVHGCEDTYYDDFRLSWGATEQ